MGVDFNSPALKQEWNDRVFTENQAKLKALLGNEDYATYQAYQAGLFGQGAIEAMAGNLYYSDTPLTAAQGERLAAVIKQHTSLGSGKVITDWPAIYEEAGQGMLSPAQIEVLRAANDRNDIFLQKKRPRAENSRGRHGAKKLGQSPGSDEQQRRLLEQFLERAEELGADGAVKHTVVA